MISTILSVITLASAGYLHNAAFGTPPVPVSQKERSAGADIFATYSEFFRLTVGTYKQVTEHVLGLQFLMNT